MYYYDYIVPRYPAPIAVVPNSGPTAGGILVTIEVIDSTNMYAAAIGGQLLTGFAIVDPTHVSGILSPGIVGLANVVTWGLAASAVLIGAFTFDAPPFTGQLGTLDSQLGNIELGVL